MKRTLAIILVALMLAGMQALGENELAFAKYDEPITITMARGVASDAHFDEKDPEKKSYAENRWISAYLDRLGVKVEYEWIAADSTAGMAKWSAALASGGLPDAAAVSDQVYAMLLDAGVVADMTEFFDAYASDDYKASITDDMKAQLTYDGAMYGLPYSAKGYQDGAGLFVRKDWLDKLGLAVPATLEEVVDVARAFVENQLGGENTIGILVSSSPNGQGAGGRWDGMFNPFKAYLNIWVPDEEGKLVFSNTRDEMKDALLFFQSLYEEGLINKDFAVTNADQATEYVAGGKCGVIYGVSWAPVTSIQSLYNNDPEAEIIALTLPGLAGDDAPTMQANAPAVPKIFVNAECAHPEAVVKLVNLTIDLVWNESNEFYRDETGFSWFKYLSFGDFFSMGAEIMTTSYEITRADETGEPLFTNEQWAGVYNNYLKAKAGERSLIWYTLLYGEGSLYMQYKDKYEAGLIVTNSFYGLPTETMALKSDIINNALMTAMLEVMMGADISVYEQAVTEWYDNGGQVITEEVNAWADK